MKRNSRKSVSIKADVFKLFKLNFGFRNDKNEETDGPQDDKSSPVENSTKVEVKEDSYDS